MKYLSRFVSISDRVSGWVFHRIFLFFNGGTRSENEDISGNYKFNYQLNGSNQFEWRLHQGLADIYRYDFFVLYNQFTPGFLLKIFHQWRKDILFFFFLDESLEEVIPNSQEMPPLDLDNEGTKKQTWVSRPSRMKNCFRSFVYRAKALITKEMEGLLQKSDKTTAIYVYKYKKDYKFLNFKQIIIAIRNPGIFNLISSHSFHKRI